MAHRAYLNLPQWPIALGKIHCSGLQHRKTLEVEFLGEFEYKFETALDQESEDLLGTFGEIILDKKISRYCLFKNALFFENLS